MSLSDANDKEAPSSQASSLEENSLLEEEASVEWGTIYTHSGVQTLGSIEKSKSTQWSGEDERKYLDRVKEKAQAMATEILSEAKNEAAVLKENAYKQGYEQGISEANDELETFRSTMADSVSSVISSIEGQCSHIFGQWRTEIVEVAKIAVEKMTSITLSEERTTVLDSLLTEAITCLETSRILTIHVHPDDEAVITDIIELTKKKYPEITSWRVKPDESVSPGGLVIENESSLASGLVESRHLAVTKILEHLTISDKLP